MNENPLEAAPYGWCDECGAKKRYCECVTSVLQTMELTFKANQKAPDPDILQIKAILNVVASVWGIDPKQIWVSRSREDAIARHVCMALSYRLSTMPMTKIARAFGKQDHGSVKHAMKRVDLAMQDEEMRKKIEDIIKQLPPLPC